jgi:transposase
LPSTRSLVTISGCLSRGRCILHVEGEAPYSLVDNYDDIPVVLLCVGGYDDGMRRDGRGFDHRTLESIRLMAVERVREGERASSVIASFGFNRTTIYRWLDAASKPGAGLSALRSRPATGRPRRLTPRQEQQVFRWVNGRDPRQYGLDFGLWTRRLVAALIERKFGIRLGVTAVGELLAKLGLTPQKPLQRAYQRDPEAIEKWQREQFPAIARQAKASGGEVYFWDESGFRADAVHGRTWGKKGQTPVVERPGQRQSISAASAVNARGGFWYCIYEGGLNAELFVTLLRKMMRHRSRPVHLVLDGLPAHKTALVKTYVASTNGMLTLHFLPGYAPELNPDELVWSHMKRTGVARAPLRRGERLGDKVAAQLAAIKRLPQLVRSFFQAPTVSYITDW